MVCTFTIWIKFTSGIIHLWILFLCFNQKEIEESSLCGRKMIIRHGEWYFPKLNKMLNWKWISGIIHLWTHEPILCRLPRSSWDSSTIYYSISKPSEVYNAMGYFLAPDDDLYLRTVLIHDFQSLNLISKVNRHLVGLVRCNYVCYFFYKSGY